MAQSARALPATAPVTTTLHDVAENIRRTWDGLHADTVNIGQMLNEAKTRVKNGEAGKGCTWALWCIVNIHRTARNCDRQIEYWRDAKKHEAIKKEDRERHAKNAILSAVQDEAVAGAKPKLALVPSMLAAADLGAVETETGNSVSSGEAAPLPAAADSVEITFTLELRTRVAGMSPEKLAEFDKQFAEFNEWYQPYRAEHLAAAEA